MGQAIPFDTLAYVKKLKAAGMPENQAEVQAEALAEIVENRLATKQDIFELKRDIEELRAELKRDLKELEMRLTIRLGTIVAAGIAIVAALVKLL